MKSQKGNSDYLILQFFYSELNILIPCIVLKNRKRLKKLMIVKISDNRGELN